MIEGLVSCAGVDGKVSADNVTALTMRTKRLKQRGLLVGGFAFIFVFADG